MRPPFDLLCRLNPKWLARYFRVERPREHARLREFRLRFTPFALSQAALGLPWAGAALVAPPGAKAFLLGLSALKVLGGGAVSGALIHLFFPIRANATEVRGRAFIGLARRVRWHDITSVRRCQWLFAPYLLLSTGRKKNFIWLPLFLCEQDDFNVCLETWLDAQHPIRGFLRDQNVLSSTEVNPCQAS